MKNYQVNSYKPSLSKPHSSTLQELRHERKAEDRRLDELKKALQTKMCGNRRESQDVRAA